ncbi:hypothetical protein CWR48_13520 [Oceanobacillus arenosus]|uniref:Uncharacterized protein n=1 Tax=Oceanobacillus arenosus TaxID=1229153 RepID=A0A3D8PQL0_9BACI|nr:hypothetical protein [Oceanobacillus arenosus]RDW17538.1 hypothetical protein CWR48_13520 [Oceanobacillus arenosus]
MMCILYGVVGLRPLGAGFIPWEAVPVATLGQVIARTFIQWIGALILNQVYVVKAKLVTMSEIQI